MKRFVFISVSLMLAGVVTACGNNEEVDEESLNNEPVEVNESNELEDSDEETIDSNGNNSDELNDTNTDLEENSTNSNSNSTAEDNTTEKEEVVPEYEINPNDFSVQPIDDASEEVVLLTIDDAPDSHGAEMAEILAELEAPAIFFVNGHFIQSDEGKEQLQKIYDLGFEIGNHTMTHPNLRDISEEEQYDEIVQLNDEIEAVTGERPRFFRPPHGADTDYMMEVLEEENMQTMNWSYGYDWEAEYMNKEAIAKIMVETELLRSGANLLMHDREFTKDALEDIVSGLRDKGYEMVDPDAIK
ncbi:polysaccharide deacetylase family protein [Salipaludibacillus sp. CF4.18]|uniref:polysaccharide deacetylase family protein n=1 Tax=Salipaludibacillus sp. CF4.18 TaxID=3373081 RepID=UPI003EE7AE14